MGDLLRVQYPIGWRGSYTSMNRLNPDSARVKWYQTTINSLNRIFKYANSCTF